MSKVCVFQIEFIVDMYLDCLHNNGRRINVDSQSDGEELLSILTHNYEDIDGHVYQNVSGDWLVWIEPKLHG